MITTHHTSPLNEAITITPLGDVGPGGAPARYRLVLYPMGAAPDGKPVEELEIKFHNGPIANGFNGFTNEALIAVVIDRLEGFQAGPFGNGFNAIALKLLKWALEALSTRSAERIKRGVEGQIVP